MSIVTKTGDQGITSLMYGRRVSKSHPRVEAYGTLDELNAVLGLARSQARRMGVRETVLLVQKDLVVLMGEMATAAEDLPRYVKDGFALLKSEQTMRLETEVRAIEAQGRSPQDWATPGGSVAGAALDLARTVCRRAERCVCALQEAGELQNAEVLVYLNRLSDLLWLLARQEETE
jgi:cob(I)alamin adenosyltransferase